MIHDAIVPVTCDNDKCRSEMEIEPPYTYTTYLGHGGAYDTSDATIEKLLRASDWIVIDGKHYCCQECADKAKGAT